MLGSIKSREWQWSIWGKHPAFKDFFHLGPPSPLFDGLREWVKTGYAQIKIQNSPRHFFSWRFWMRGKDKESLACGLLRDSSDSLGRPHPFLIMGAGYLAEWEKNWDLLPLAFEASWSRMEMLTAQVFKELKSLEGESQKIPLPAGEWISMAQRRDKKAEVFYPLIEEQFKKNLGKENFFLPLDQVSASAQIIVISLYLSFWKKRREQIPSSIFMGGSLTKTFLAFYHRPLWPKDFLALWSDSSVNS